MFKEATKQAINECIREHVLADFFREHKDEVMKVMVLDFTFERRLELEKRDGIEEGRIAGRKEGLAEGRKAGHKEGLEEGLMAGGAKKLISQVCQKLRKGKAVSDIADCLEESEAVIQKICDIAQDYAPDYDVEKIYADFCTDKCVCQ